MIEKNSASHLLDSQAIERHLPHRFPFLLIDRVVSYRAGSMLKAIKNITYNEPCFTGHFPGNPIMPGVLIIEAMAQATGLLFSITYEEVGILYLAGVDKTRFKRIVVPGDRLVIEIQIVKARKNLWKSQGVASVEDEVACTATLMLAREPAK